MATHHESQNWISPEVPCSASVVEAIQALIDVSPAILVLWIAQEGQPFKQLETAADIVCDPKTYVRVRLTAADGFAWELQEDSSISLVARGDMLADRLFRSTKVVVLGKYVKLLKQLELSMRGDT